MKVKIIIMILCWLTIQNGLAQKITGFSSKVEQYPDELANLLGSNLSDNDKKLLTDFTTAWKTNLFDDNEKKDIVKLSVQIFDRKGLASLFKSLLGLLQSFKRSSSNVDNYRIWMGFIGKYTLNKKATLGQLTNLLECLNDLQSDNFLNNTTSAQWKYMGQNFKFIAEND